MVQKTKDKYNRLHTIPACDGRTDGQTDGQISCHGIVGAMYTRRAVKMNRTIEKVDHVKS